MKFLNKPMNSWKTTNQSLEKTFEFTTFEEAMQFMQDATPFISQTDHHPTWSNTYNSQEQCEGDGWKDCALASSTGGTTYPKPNQFLIASSYGLGYFAIAFLSLAGFASFFIATAESIIEGMGGNIRTKKD